jgi:hypothetical protein
MTTSANTITIIDIDTDSPTTVVLFKVNTPQHHETVIINNNDDTFTVYPLNSNNCTIFTADQLAKLFTDYPTLRTALDSPWSGA